MSDRLTAARLDLIHEMFDLFAPDNLVLESEAGDLLDRYAARAVDEALSVDGLRRWLHTVGLSPRHMDDGPDCEHLAAALVAHLRGPR